MIAISVKPVRECAGCELNLGKSCGVFEHPVLQWKHRRCEGYNNAELKAKYVAQQKLEGAKARKQARAERAKLAHTVQHDDGVRKLRAR